MQLVLEQLTLPAAKRQVRRYNDRCFLDSLKGLEKTEIQPGPGRSSQQRETGAPTEDSVKARLLTNVFFHWLDKMRWFTACTSNTPSRQRMVVTLAFCIFSTSPSRWGASR